MGRDGNCNGEGMGRGRDGNCWGRDENWEREGWDGEGMRGKGWELQWVRGMSLWPRQDKTDCRDSKNRPMKSRASEYEHKQGKTE